MMGISASAQEFNPHWYLQLRGGAAETIGETNFMDLLSPAADLSLGYQFTPVFGLRGNAMGWQAKGAMSGLETQTLLYKFNFAQAALDATFDIANMFNTDLDRFLRPYAYLGVRPNTHHNTDAARAIEANRGSVEHL